MNHSDLVKKLRHGNTHQRLIKYCGKLVREHFQLNRSSQFICWERYMLPANGDKSKAIKHNEFLSLKDVISIISKK